jgi:hypothetical protein
MYILLPITFTKMQIRRRTFNGTSNRLTKRANGSTRKVPQYARIKSNPTGGAGLPSIPPWAKIVNYRTMTNGKKDKAVAGNKVAQYEWMVEEVNEFYEAIHLNNMEEIRDEAMGLIRTVQQFQDSKRVVSLWKKVKRDVSRVFPTRKIFLETFAKWHAKKLAKNQALGVVADDLLRIL